MWDLFWTKWHLDMCSSVYLEFSEVMWSEILKMAIKVYIMCVLMFPSTNIALLTEYLYSVMLVNEDLYRVCLSRKLSVFF